MFATLITKKCKACKGIVTNSALSQEIISTSAVSPHWLSAKPGALRIRCDPIYTGGDQINGSSCAASNFSSWDLNRVWPHVLLGSHPNVAWFWDFTFLDKIKKLLFLIWKNNSEQLFLFLSEWLAQLKCLLERTSRRNLQRQNSFGFKFLSSLQALTR